MNHWQELDRKFFMNTGHRRLGVTLVRGEGARVWDDQGREYLDFIAGWGVNALGHCHPVVVSAIREQAGKLTQVSMDVYNVPQVELARLLLETTGFDKIFFASTGTEANEGAVKLARKYGKLHRNGAYEVISTLNSFHGRTLAMVAATGKPVYQAPYTPLPAGFLNVPYNSLEAIQQATTDKTVAVLLEPIQGEGGVNVPDDDYFKKVRAWCNENGLLLILDEVQTGMGRTGTLFAYQRLGVVPDILTVGKGLGGGVPISAILVKEKAAVFGPGDHGHTFAGNPLMCAAGYATLRYMLDSDVPGNARRMGQYFTEQLKDLRKKYSFITDIRGRGLLLAIEFNKDWSAEIAKECVAEGLLLNNMKPNAIRFMPPLIITIKEIDEAVGILDRVLARVSSPDRSGLVIGEGVKV
ncbi:MAG: aspartate aminotransferase family protein [Chloroflexi bacterium]|nr:aspartate aminotransferase family protein [Chloroflexota bacterium]